MPIRLHEIHPTVNHFPLALYPTSLACDIIGRATDNKKLLYTGRVCMIAAAAGTAVAGVAGVLAQEGVRTDEQSEKMMVTHRNLNITFFGLVTGLAIRRALSRRPGLGYLALATAGMGALVYSGWLGGKLVYDHGVGVKAAGGVHLDRAPSLSGYEAKRVPGVAARELRTGLQTAVRDLLHGRIAPSLRSEPTPTPER